MKQRKRRVHVATGADAYELRKFCLRHLAVDDGDVVFHLAQCLAFLIQGSDATELSRNAKILKNKFAVRKLRAALKMLDEIFRMDEE